MNDTTQRKGKYLYHANRAAHVSILWGDCNVDEMNRLVRMERSLNENPAFENLTFAPVNGYCGVIEEFEVRQHKGQKIFYPDGVHVISLPHYMQVVGNGYFQYE